MRIAIPLRSGRLSIIRQVCVIVAERHGVGECSRVEHGCTFRYTRDEVACGRYVAFLVGQGL